jgi:Kef-type K+ transport system membrane component KefB
MIKVGLPAVLVAVLGVLAPFALGWGVGALLRPDLSVYVHAFLGATLTAISVGITARVLQDLQRSQSAEARVILGAAVIDDGLGQVILAVVAGAIAAADQGGTLSYGEIGRVLGKAVAFVFGALAARRLYLHRACSVWRRHRPRPYLAGQPVVDEGIFFAVVIMVS